MHNVRPVGTCNLPFLQSMHWLQKLYEMGSLSLEHTYILLRAYRKAGYLTMVIAGYIPANSQLAAAIATIVKSLSIGK